MVDLKPCPFCGGTNIDAAGWASQNSSGPACDDCGASAGSALADTPEANIAAWNNRKGEAAAEARVMEKAAKIADDHAFNAWHIAEARGQNSACASGRNYGGRAIAKAIRAALNGCHTDVK